MTSAMRDQFPAPTETGQAVPVSSIRTPDLGLLDTLSTKMHCRTPMKRVDPDETPLYQPILVDGARVVPVGTRLPSAIGLSPAVETYRCACGFTIDVPAAAEHALAS